LFLWYNSIVRQIYIGGRPMKTQENGTWIEAIEIRPSGAHWEDTIYVYEVRSAECGILGRFPKREYAVSFIRGMVVPELLETLKSFVTNSDHDGGEDSCSECALVTKAEYLIQKVEGN
jgi:hypothetical protein